MKHTQGLGFFDIESNLIPPTGSKDIRKIHCIGIMNEEPGINNYTSHYMDKSDGSLQLSVKHLNECNLIVSFNGIGFDGPVIERVLNTSLTSKHLDLFLIAKVMFTSDALFSIDRQVSPDDTSTWGHFSLKAFAKRMGGNSQAKIEFHDFSHLTSDMITYMEGDVQITKDLYYTLLKADNYPTQQVIDLEHDVARIVAVQQDYGFKFNVPKARELNKKLLREKFVLERELAKTFKAMYIKDGPVQTTNNAIRRKVFIEDTNYSIPRLSPVKPLYTFFKNGRIKLPAKTKYKYFDVPHKFHYMYKEGEYQNIKLTKFEATDNQIVHWLKRMYDFDFTTYTQKGNIRVDRDDLEALGDYGKQLRRLMKIKKDQSQLGGDNGLIANTRPDGTITTRIDTNGTATGRFTSSGSKFKKGQEDIRIKGVNLNQIPAQVEFRELFDAPTYYNIDEDLHNKLKEYIHG